MHVLKEREDFNLLSRIKGWHWCKWIDSQFRDEWWITWAFSAPLNVNR